MTHTKIDPEWEEELSNQFGAIEMFVDDLSVTEESLDDLGTLKDLCEHFRESMKNHFDDLRDASLERKSRRD